MSHKWRYSIRTPTVRAPCISEIQAWLVRASCTVLFLRLLTKIVAKRWGAKSAMLQTKKFIFCIIIFKLNFDYTITIFALRSSKLPPPSWNVGHSRIFSTDYEDREKTLLLLIIKYWDSIWVIKYVLIKLPCNHYKKSGLLWRKSHDDCGIRHQLTVI